MLESAFLRPMLCTLSTLLNRQTTWTAAARFYTAVQIQRVHLMVSIVWLIRVPQDSEVAEQCCAVCRRTLRWSGRLWDRIRAVKACQGSLGQTVKVL